MRHLIYLSFFLLLSGYSASAQNQLPDTTENPGTVAPVLPKVIKIAPVYEDRDQVKQANEENIYRKDRTQNERTGTSAVKPWYRRHR